MSGIKIITGVSCPKCQGKVALLSRANGIVGKRLDPKTIGECMVCAESVVYQGHLETELLDDKGEVKSEAIKSDERPSKYHLKNVFAHKEYFDWYDLVDAKRASNVIIDPRIEHVEKKLFVNDRGHKGYLQDMIESRNQLDMAIQKEQERLENE